MLFKQISEDLKNAMKAQDKTKVETLRFVFSKIKDEAIALGQREDISDDVVISVLKKRVKQGKDSAEQYKQGGREDLLKVEEDQLKIIEEYLPAMMSEADIEKIVIVKKVELGITDSSKIGVLMGAVMKETAGQADGNVVKNIVVNSFK
jgi:hypothetical protein